MKVGIVGSGFVGATAAYALVLRGSCSDIVLTDKDPERARAEAADVGDASPVSHGVRVRAGDYADLAGAQLVVLTAGANQKDGEDRLALLAKNAEVFREVVPQVRERAPDAVLLVATNPVDVMTDLTVRLAGNGAKVMGSGTVLDSARFRQEIAVRAGVSAQHVHAYVLGEHGDSEVLAWSGASVAGLPVQGFMTVRGQPWSETVQAEIDAAVRGAAANIIAGKRATYYGIGAAIARIAESVLRDRQTILTVSAPSRYGVSLSLPRLVGAGGASDTFEPKLSAQEQAGLDHSAEVLRAAVEQL